MIMNAKDLPNEYRDALGGPDIAAPAEGFRAAGQQGGQAGQLRGGEQGLGAGRGPVAQSLHAVCLRAFEPLTDGALRHIQGDGNLLLFPALLMQFPGAASAPLAPVDRWGRSCRSSCVYVYHT